MYAHLHLLSEPKCLKSSYSSCHVAILLLYGLGGCQDVVVIVSFRPRIVPTVVNSAINQTDVNFYAKGMWKPLGGPMCLQLRWDAKGSTDIWCVRSNVRRCSKALCEQSVRCTTKCIPAGDSAARAHLVAP